MSISARARKARLRLSEGSDRLHLRIGPKALDFRRRPATGCWFVGFKATSVLASRNFSSLEHVLNSLHLPGLDLLRSSLATGLSTVEYWLWFKPRSNFTRPER